MKEPLKHEAWQVSVLGFEFRVKGVAFLGV